MVSMQIGGNGTLRSGKKRVQAAEPGYAHPGVRTGLAAAHRLIEDARSVLRRPMLVHPLARFPDMFTSVTAFGG